MKYRADIDGLRAVAVLPVVAFHLGIGSLSGGFVGVDVFFVISGFLITGHLQSDLEQQRFSIVRFYERRLRRIGPALLVMLCGVSAVSVLLMYPHELFVYGASAVTALFSASNFYFWMTAGYFAEPALAKPLLHTWSLAVEEQYYLVFPVLLAFCTRFSLRRRNAVLVLLTAFSFAVNIYASFAAPTAAFYLPFGRVWELLLGALLALEIIPAPQSAVARNACVCAGLISILLGILFIRQSQHFPGFAALLPCAGAALVLAGGANGPTWPGRLLQLRPLVFIGLISYSLYLWHWPIIVFERAYLPNVAAALPRWTEIATLFSLSMAAAILSWWLVERPFRNRSLVVTRRLVALTGLAAILLCLANGLFLISSGLPSRFPASVQKAASYLDYDWKGVYRAGKCYFTTVDSYSDFDSAACLRMGGGGNYLLLGDSHAAHLWPGLQTVVSSQNFLQATASGCKPLLPLQGDARCTRLMSRIYKEFVPTHHLDGVLLSVLWRTGDLPDLSRTIDWWKARHIPVILIGPSPEYEADLPRLLAASIRQGNAHLPDKYFMPQVRDIDTAMASLARRKAIQYVSLYKSLCAGSHCQVWAGDVPMMFDSGHFTAAGSVAAAREMKRSGLFSRSDRFPLRQEAP